MTFGAGFGFPKARFPMGAGPTINMDFAGTAALPPSVTFTRASTGSYFDATGTLQSAAIDAARLDYSPSTLQCNGLLIEEQRTNSVRNNTMQGTAAGTPGTLPTNWIGDTTVAGVTRQIVGTGVEKGITYIDIRVSGTTSGALIFGIQTEGNTQTAALNAQRWTSSLYARVVAGSFANITRVSHIVRYNDAAGVLLTSGALDITPTTAALNTQRFANTVLSSNALTAFVGQVFQVEAGAGVAIDITLRIGLPQLELGFYATSVIPTTTVEVTRALDQPFVNTVTPWFNPIEGSIVTEYQLLPNSAQAITTTRTAVDFTDGTANNRIAIRAIVAALVDVVNIRSAGGVSDSLSSTGSTVGTSPRVVATAFKANDYAVSATGAVTVATLVGGPMPVGISNLRLGGIVTNVSTNQLGGWLRKMSYYPRRLSNADLLALTA